MKQNAIKLNEEDYPTKVILESRNTDLELIMNKTYQNKKCECHNPQRNGITSSREGGEII